MIANVKETRKQFLSGESKLSDLISTKNWSDTPLGDIAQWPQSLKTSVNLILNSQHPMWIGWGPEATFLYNDAYIQVLSMAKHPWALGRPAAEVWAEIWDVCGPLAEKVFNEGKATFLDDVRLFMNRGNFVEETYYSFSYSPIYDESGKVAGLFCPSAETTGKVLHTRRLKTLAELASNALLAKTTHDACISSFETLKKNEEDIPFALFYLVESEKRIAHLEQCTFAREVESVFPDLVPLTQDEGHETHWPIAEVVMSREAKIVSIRSLAGIPPGCSGNEVEEAIILPVISSVQDTPVGILIAGISPCRRLDADYRTFYDLLANQIGVAIQNARSVEEERKRIEMLAEIDRAKTVFFSNVSHEFRTPLTLMLGPIEDILNKSLHLLPEDHQAGLQSTHRNAIRLYRLVNTLLDFSRIEAGRISASFAPVDLSSFTTDLASNFRSTIESANMELAISCNPISTVYVDPQMWEKIVFNLLSNAFKYTLQGKISVLLSREDDMAVLKVTDTGIGIPADELPHMFERFHRVKNATGRTFEGTGIGLSLVKELVNLHKGTIGVESREGIGSTFTVSIPLGKGHLPSSQVTDQPFMIYESNMAAVYMKEIESMTGDKTSQWHQDVLPDQVTVRNTADKKGRVLIVDDNADMRQYISRLLSAHYEVANAENGKVALEKMKSFAPALVISDIMMPVMNGIQLLHAIRQDHSLSGTPVLLLSARAGEEARIEGYQLGADDYLVKPFSANELIARVNAQLTIARIRQNAEAHLRNFFQQAPIIIVVFRGPEFVIEVANEKLLQYWGKTREQTLHKKLLDVLPEITNQGLTDLLSKVLTTGISHVENEREVPLFRNGKMETTYVSFVYEPLRNEHGEITHVMVLANEVTESVVARKKIEASEMKFRNLVMQAPVGIVILRGEKFRVEIVNDSYLKIINKRAEDLVGKPVLDVIEIEGKEILNNILTHVLNTGEPYFGSEFPIKLSRNGKMEETFHDFVYQAMVEDGRVVGIVAVVIEVTGNVKARKIAQEMATALEDRVQERTKELTVSNAKLENSNRELEQFAYIASHDLQEPLRKIQTFSELLHKHSDDPVMITKYINKIDSSAARMAGLIRDVLNYSSLNRSGEEFQPVDLNEILENVKSDFELLIQETHATLRSDKLPIVRGVALQLHQLFSNLIGNSLKFSRENPRITITSQILANQAIESQPALDPLRKYVLLTFSDNGIGFEQEYADKIFVIFQRLNYSGKHNGTGIGLALCKKIVENHNGFISARSEVNKGAIFQVYLPL